MEKLQFLKEITDLNGIPGQEHAVGRYMKDAVKDVADEIIQDNLGSVIAKKVGDADGPRIMVAGHLDEVGFVVHYIDDNGFVKFAPVGGWWGQVMLAQQVQITTRKGLIRGVIGSTPPHILTPEARQKPVEIKDMYIDLGVENKDEALATGIRPGDMITPYIEFHQMANPKYLLAKAWDNRIGTAVAIEALKQLANELHPNIYYGVGTVQEEVGCRGAQTSGNLINPDIAIAVDVGLSGGTPGVTAEIQAKMGKGPILLIQDAGLIGHKDLRDYIVDLCEELEIPFQYDVLGGGGTDAATMHKAHNGAPAISLCIPSRYIHSHTSMIHQDDYDNTVKLVVELVKRLDRETVNKITFA
ncbi:MAG: M42 family metallopeptidase [Turicibacter sp.]|nr:M42 family metallopeptidase [Turicibacter sp.]